MIVNFQNMYVEFVTIINESTDLHIEFWREIQEETPEIEKIKELGTKITLSLENI